MEATPSSRPKNEKRMTSAPDCDGAAAHSIAVLNGADDKIDGGDQ